MEIKLIKKENARNFMEGVEYCREYLVTEKLVFGSSELLPGQRGAKDPGHPNSHEVFYVVLGEVLLYVEKRNEYFPLKAGDAIIMPEGISHTLINVGEGKAIVTWTMAPPMK